MTLASELKMEKYYYFHFSLNFHSYRKSFTWLCILGVKLSHLKWYKLIYSISMEQNGVKAKEILLLVTIASCSFLIYQLTFCVQNSCISNSPYKMSACSGTVSCQRTVFRNPHRGPVPPCCQDIAPVTCHTQLLRIRANEL